MKEEITRAELKEDISRLQKSFDYHVIANEEREKKIDEMYSILVSGNGKPSFQERVRTLERLARILIWLAGGFVFSVGGLLFGIVTGKIGLIFR